MFINFWATYCLPCREEMPALQAMAPRFRQAGIDLIGVSIDVETADQVADFLRESGITYPVFTTDSPSISEVFQRGEIMIPVSFLLDGEGRILEVLSGWSEESRGELERLVAPDGPPQATD